MKVVAFILSLLSASVLLAQTPKQWAKHGDEAFKEGDFYGAAFYFEKAIKADTGFIEGLWMAAESYRNYNHYEKAADRYARVLQLDQDETYYQAAFYLPLMRKSLEDYQAASEGFENYAGAYRSRSALLYKRAKQEIISCEYAMARQNDSVLVEVIHPDLTVNSYEGEINPFYASDYTLYFSALRHPDTAKRTVEHPSFFSFMGVRNDSLFVLDSLFQPDGMHLGNVSVSPLRPRVYYTLCSDETGCAVYYRDSTLHGEGLDPAVRIEALDVTGYTATHPVATRWGNQEVLLFASNRPRGRGGMDLWYSEIKDGNKFGRPKNLGKTINSPENEITPFYDTASQTLYFSSLWHNGFGGYDIQKSEGSLRSWSEPENAGKPINSPANDLYFSKNDSLKLMTWVSNRSGSYGKKGEHCCNDIYVGREIRVPDTLPVDTPDVPVKDSVPPVLVQVPVVHPVSVYFENDYPDPKTTRTTSSQSLEDLFAGYMKSISDYTTVQTDTAAFGLFERESLKRGLEKLNAFIKEVQAYRQHYDTVTIVLRGFASPLAKTDYNLNLSKRRIDAVKTYLFAHTDWQEAMNKGVLILREEPLGETESKGTVSDALSDKKASVYGLEAMNARRVELSIVR